MIHWLPKDTRRKLIALALLALAPLAVLVVLGVVHLWQQGWIVPVAVGWLACALLLFAGAYVWPFRATTSKANLSLEQQEIPALDEPLDLPPSWTAHDINIWKQCIKQIDDAVTDHTPWASLEETAIELLITIAAHYQRGKKVAAAGKMQQALWRFTAPEALLVVSETSARYRLLLLETIPFIDDISIGTAQRLIRHHKPVKKGWRMVSTARRLARLVNPIAAIAGEIGEHFTGLLFNDFSLATQRQLKRLLLQEVAQVGIDLYSGRLKTTLAEIAHHTSDAERTDFIREPHSIEPLRVVVVGQTSAGKSTLVNSLLHGTEGNTQHTPPAETDHLQATHRTVAYPWGDQRKLIDTPGLQVPDSLAVSNPLDDAFGKACLEVYKEWVDIATAADMLLWVVRANQPARAPDVQCLAAMNQFYHDNPARKPPPMIIAVTQINALGNAATGVLSSEISRSLQEQLGVEYSVPMIGIAATDTSGRVSTDTLEQAIDASVEAAGHVQWNRRRLEKLSQPRHVQWLAASKKATRSIWSLATKRQR